MNSQNCLKMFASPDVDLLFSLPTILSCQVVADWLSLKDVSSLDVAYCNAYERSNPLQDLFESKELVLQQEPENTHEFYRYRATEDYMAWVYARNIHTSKLVVIPCSESDLKGYVEYTNTFGQCVTQLRGYKVDYGGSISSAMLVPLVQECPNLEVFILEECIFYKPLLNALQLCPTLRELHLIHCDDDVYDESIVINECHPCMQLSSVSLSSYANTSIAILRMCLPQHIRHLHVTFSSHYEETDEDQQGLFDETCQVLEHCVDLKALGFTYLHGFEVKESVLTALFQKCCYIQHVDLGGSDFGTEFARIVCSYLPQLKSLHISIDDVNGRCLQEISNHCPGLEALYIWFEDSEILPSLTANLNMVLDRCTNLRVLHFQTDESLNGLDFSHMGHLVSLTLIQYAYEHCHINVLLEVTTHCHRLQYLCCNGKALAKCDFAAVLPGQLRSLRVFHVSDLPDDCEEEMIPKVELFCAMRPQLRLVWGEKKYKFLEVVTGKYY